MVYFLLKLLVIVGFIVYLVGMMIFNWNLWSAKIYYKKKIKDEKEEKKIKSGLKKGAIIGISGAVIGSGSFFLYGKL